jgi:hypothetical protein
MAKNPDPGSGMNISDLIFENWGYKYLNSFMHIRDLFNPGSEINIPDPQHFYV